MEPLRPSKELLQRYLSDRCSDEERLLVNEWYSHLDVEGGRQEDLTDETQLYTRIQRAIDKAGPVGRRFAFIRYGIAASLLIASSLILWLFLFKPERETISVSDSHLLEKQTLNTFTNESTQVIFHLLPDSSTVQLLPGAVIQYPSTFPIDSRPIAFTGEGFFSIRKNPHAPFTIETGSVKTEVLGTSFNLRSDPARKAFNLRVASGKVAVTFGGGQTPKRYILTKDQHASILPDQTGLLIASMNEVDLEKNLWVPTSLRYHDTPLKKVIVELASTFGTRIALENRALGECTLTVDFQNDNLPEILNMLNLLLGTSYEIQPDRVLIKGERCGG